MTPTLFLKPGKGKSLLRRHPWIYHTAIDRFEGKTGSGGTVLVRSHDGRFLARAALSPASQIRARVWTFDEAEPVDHAFFKRRIQAALRHRQQWVQGSNAVRLIFAEADGLPGLIVDQYADQLVCQFTAAGVEHFKNAIVSALVQLTGCPNVYERSDAAVRQREGLPLQTGVLAGAEPPAHVAVVEHGVHYGVDVRQGHKTGFYIDQRDNRLRVQELAAGRDVLNCFCYTGGFSLAALKGGAKSVLSIDSSGEALAQARSQMAMNGFDDAKAEWWDADVFKSLRALREAGRSFDLIVLDPPKFAPSAQHIDRASRAYKDINRQGMQLLRPGGLLLTYSCSGAIDPELFQKIVASATAEAASHEGLAYGSEWALLARLSSGADHPLRMNFPEGDYLKGLLLQRVL
jgi:23S rRNA (cytosine1962-C5)-methyltransferase